MLYHDVFGLIAQQEQGAAGEASGWRLGWSRAPVSLGRRKRVHVWYRLSHNRRVRHSFGALLPVRGLMQYVSVETQDRRPAGVVVAAEAVIDSRKFDLASVDMNTALDHAGKGLAGVHTRTAIGAGYRARQSESGIDVELSTQMASGRRGADLAERAAVVGEAGAVSVTAVSGVREVLPGRLIIGGELCIVYAAPIGARELDYSHSAYSVGASWVGQPMGVKFRAGAREWLAAIESPRGGGGGGGGDDGPRWQAYVSHAVGTAAHWVVGWAWTQGASMLSVQVSPDAREGGVDVRVRRSRDCGWGVAVHARQYCGGLMLMDCALKSYVQLSLP